MCIIIFLYVFPKYWCVQLLYRHNEGIIMNNGIILLCLQKYIGHFILRKGLNLCWCVRQTDGRGRRMETATLTHNFFFSWPYHAVLSSRLHLALLLLGWGVFNRRSVVGHCPSGAPGDSLALPWTQAETDSWLTLPDCSYLTWTSTYIIS